MLILVYEMLQIMKRKSVVISWIVSIFLTISPSAFAHETKKPLKQNHFLHDLMYQHEYLAVPISTMVVGALCGGTNKYGRVYGALIGFSLGALDQLLVAKGWAHRYFLSSGIIASGVLNKYSLDAPLQAIDRWTSTRQWPYMPRLHSGTIPVRYLGGISYSGPQIVRFSLGLAAANGAFDNLKDFIPLHGLIAGMVYGEEKGSLIGGGLELADKFLMANNISSQPYGTQFLDGLVFSKIFIPHLLSLSARLPFVNGLAVLGARPLFAEGMGILAVHLFYSYAPINTTASSANSKEEWKAVELSGNLMELASSLIDEKTLTSHLQKQTIVLLASELLSLHVNLALMGHYQVVDDMFSRLNDRVVTTPNNIRGPLIGLSLFTVPYFIRKLTLNYIADYFSSSLTKQMSDVLYRELLTGEVPMKLSQNVTKATFVTHMRKDLETLAKASEILSSAVDAGVTGIFSIGYLQSTNSIDLIAYLFVYDKFFDEVIGQLSQWEASYAPILRSYETKLSSLETESIRHADLVVRADQLPFLNELHEKLTEESRVVFEKWRISNALLLAITLPKGMLDYVISYWVVSFKVYDGSASFEDRLKITQLGAKTAEFLSWKSAKSGTIKQIEGASASLKSLVSQMREGENTKCQKILYSSKESSSLKIDIKDLRISLEGDEKPFVQVDQLILEKGFHAVTGRSGSGKSSFLAKIKGLKHDHLCASGQIIYKTPDGKPPIISFVTQSDFFPPNTSLYQLANYRVPAHERASQGQQDELLANIVDLLKELDFDPAETGLLDSLLEENEWHSILSGGQKKKLALVALMLTKPQIAILDESFTALDERSIKKVQKMLRRLLPDTLFLIVDHHAETNNSEGFYDKILLFENGQVFVQ